MRADEAEKMFAEEHRAEEQEKQMEIEKCILCKKDIIGFGNNAEPLAHGRCCDECNGKVIIERIKRIKKANMEETNTH